METLDAELRDRVHALAIEVLDPDASVKPPSEI